MPDIIANTTCLIILDNAGLLDILHQMYGNVFIAEDVTIEYGKELPVWIIVKKLQNQNYMNILKNIMDPGEASTIALSIETPGSKMVLDDMKARKFSEKMKLEFTGTLGVLLKAKEKGIIKEFKNALSLLKSHGFRLSPELEKKALSISGE